MNEEKKVYIKKDVVDGLLSYSISLHPREAILLARGRVEKDRISIEALVIPPFATHGQSFSSFPAHMLPFDASILGIAHSHPSGSLRPSAQDLAHYYGRLLIIVVPPYRSEAEIGVFDREGKRVAFSVVEHQA